MEKPSKAMNSSATWTRDDEAILIRALKKAKEDGKWGDNNPKPVAWKVCVNALSGSEKISGGARKDIKVVRRRWQRLKQEHDLIKHMRDQSGWGWDNEKNTPEVSDEVWDAYIEKISNKAMAKPLRRKGVPLFDEIAKLVDGTRATGKHTFRAGQPAPAPSTENASIPVSTSYELVIDPELLEMSHERGRTSDRESESDPPQDDATNTQRRPFHEREMDSFISTDDEGPITQTQKAKGKLVHKRSASTQNTTGNERRKMCRISAGQGMKSISTSVDTAIDKAVDVLKQIANKKSNKDLDDTGPDSPKVETNLALAMEAIQANKGYSQEEVADATEVMLNKPTAAGLYLLIKEERTRSIFLLNQIKKLKKDD